MDPNMYYQTGMSPYATYWVLFGLVALVSYLVQARLQKNFSKFSQVDIRGGLTGAEVAQRMLDAHGIRDVKITHISGQLTDNYNPTNKTLNLSDAVYGTSSVAAAAVAAHECGHAVQHARGYAPLKMRAALVPVVSFSSRIMSIVLLAGMLLINVFPGLMLVGIVLFATTTLFSFITLPVEIDASRRATEWLERSGITDPATHPMACKALRSAAYTYVVAALSSLATLLYYLMIFTRRR